MPIDIVAQQLDAAHAIENLILMNDYGATHQVSIKLADLSSRASMIQNATALLQQKQDQFESYAQAIEQDISDQKLADIAAKKAKLASMGIGFAPPGIFL